VRMRVALPYLLAAVLGVGCGVLAACGGSGGDRSALIPQRSADRLKSALSDVQSAVDAGSCQAAARAIVRARGILVNLPQAVDNRLVARLRRGIDNLQQIAPQECQQQDTTSTPSTTTTQTTTQTTPADTTPTDTTPTDTTPTDTTPTTTTPTTTSTTTTTAPTTTATTPAPASTTGGTTTP
jgi:cell division septation protein DedD